MTFSSFAMLVGSIAAPKKTSVNTLTRPAGFGVRWAGYREKSPCASSIVYHICIYNSRRTNMYIQFKKTDMKTERQELDLKGTRYCVSFNVRRTARAITNLYELALRPAGLRSTGFTILVAVAKFEPIAIGVLAKMLVLDSTTMTRNLRLLQKDDLLSISARASRQRFVTLRPKGRKALRSCVPLWRQVQKKFVDKIGPDCWRALQDALETLSMTAAELGNQAETTEPKGNGAYPHGQRPGRERKARVSPSIQVKPPIRRAI